MAYIKLFNMNITRPPKGSKKRHLSPNAIRGYQLESTDKGNHRFDQPPPATDRSGDSALFRVLDQSQSSGSSSDEGEVIDCGPSCDSTRRIERNFTPLNFSITDVESGCDLLNVFTEESMDIMRTNLNYKIVTKEELEGRRSSGVLGSGFIPKTLFLSESPQDSHRQLRIVPDKELGSILDYIRAHRSSCVNEFIMKEGDNCFTFGDEMILVAVEYCRMIQQKDVDGTKRSLVDIVSNCIWLLTERCDIIIIVCL